ncbi:MAG: zinc-ribbon domain-containing protein [Clostridia bacterium]|nr:zinc-ribbon domain-containing protein [Clostridia bacterium]
MFCKECGSENRNDRKFCTNCGAKLRDYTQPREDLIMPEDIQKAKDNVLTKNKLKNKFNVAKLLILLAAIAFTITTFLFDNVVQMVLIITSVTLFVAFFVVSAVGKKVIKKYEQQ